MKKDQDNNKKKFFLKKYSKPIVELKDDEEDVREVIVERNSGFNTIEVAIIILVSVLFGTIVGCILSSSRFFGNDSSNAVKEIVATYENIVKNYYDEVDEKKLVDAAVSGMIGTLDDPHSVFMDSDDATVFNDMVDGSYVGIGVTVQWVDDGFKVIEVLEGSPAKKAKIKVGDYISKIDGETVTDLTLEDFTNRVKKKAGSKIKLTVVRDDKEFDVELKESVVEILNVKGEVLDDGIGYIFIDSFASNTSRQFSNVLKSLEKKNISSLIIDVRGNPGGRLGQVYNVLEMFFGKKTVLYQVETKGEKEKILAKKSDSRDYPIVILTDQESASAAEILAACFRDNYKKAAIVGQITYGKGTIQKTAELSSGATIKYTTQKWLTPKGEWINSKGITPDFIVEHYDESGNDLQLQKAIDILNGKES